MTFSFNSENVVISWFDCYDFSQFVREGDAQCESWRKGDTTINKTNTLTEVFVKVVEESRS